VRVKTLQLPRCSCNGLHIPPLPLSGTASLALPSTRFGAQEAGKLHQLWVKLAVSVIGPFMVMEAGLVAPEKDPEPLPVQLVKV
jgi:hypothetical protein